MKTRVQARVKTRDRVQAREILRVNKGCLWVYDSGDKGFSGQPEI